MTDSFIDKLVFELTIEQQADFDVLANQIPETVVNDLNEFIDRQLDEFDIGEQDILIHKLEVDLGTIRLDEFTSIFLDKFKIAFVSALQKFLKTSAGSRHAKEDLPFILFQYFLQYGAMPWWVNTKTISFNGIFLEALQKKPTKLIYLMKSMHASAGFERRFVDNVEEELLFKLFFVSNGRHQFFGRSEIFSIKLLLKRRFGHFNTYQISLLFKKILLAFIFYPYQIRDVDKVLFLLLGSLRNNLATKDYPGYQSGIFTNNLEVLFEKNRISEHKSASTTSNHGDIGKHLSLVQRFYFYLENGYSLPEKNSITYKFQNFNILFAHLLKESLGDIVDFLLTHGRNDAIKKRFLETVSQDLLGDFFLSVAPQKRRLLEWVITVFEKVQETYKPINQTFIQVKKSINEITFEIFLNKKINSISDANYLSFLFRQTAKKYGIQYKLLLFYTLTSIDSEGRKHKYFSFQQVLMGLYQNVVANKSDRSVIAAPFSTDSYQRFLSGDFQNKDFVSSLFLELYKIKFKRSPSQVVSWIHNNIQEVNISNTVNLIKFWESFASKFDIRSEGLIIPLLVAHVQNPSLHLNGKSFNKLKTQYKINGVFCKRKPNMLELISSMHDQKATIPRQILIHIFYQLRMNHVWDDLVFVRSVQLINPRIAHLMDEYVNWLSETLQDSGGVKKKAKVFDWLFFKILFAPQKKYTLLALKDMTRSFLKLTKHLVNVKTAYPVLDQKKGLSPENRLKWYGEISSKIVRDSNYEKSFIELHRFFDLVGRAELYAVFPDAYRYDVQGLYQLLLTKYASEFVLILQKNQFNSELRDFILIQAPNWLKKDMLLFLELQHQKVLFQSMKKISKNLEDLGWIDLRGATLQLFLQKILWSEALAINDADYGDLWVLVLDKVAKNRLFSAGFWQDYDRFQSDSSKELKSDSSIKTNLFTSIARQGYLTYLQAFCPTVKKIDTAVPVFESLIYNAVFPRAHAFEGYHIQDFVPYINRLVIQNKTALGALLTKIDSAPLLYNFLRHLDIKVIQTLTQAVYQQAEVFLPLQRINSILKYFKISDPRKKHSVYVNLIVSIIQNKGNYNSEIATVLGLLIFLFDQKMVVREQFLAELNSFEFFEKIGFTLSQKELFFDQLKKQQLFRTEFEYLRVSNGKNSNLHLSSSELDLIYFPNSSSLQQFQALFERLLTQGLILKSHQTFMKEWLDFAVYNVDKKYFQSILQIYFRDKLYLFSQVNSAKSQLTYALLDKLASNENQLDTFLSRLMRESSLILGIPYRSVETSQKRQIAQWLEVWRLGNKSTSRPSDTSQSNEYYINLLINKGLDYFGKDDNLKKIIPMVVDEIRSIPLYKLFLYDFHKDFWSDLIRIKSEASIFGYFLKGDDPYLQQLQGQGILSLLLSLYFDKRDQDLLIEFMVLFQKHFYLNNSNFERKAVLFLTDFLSMSEGTKAYQEVLKLKNEELELFKKNAPVLFKNLDISRVTKSNKLDLSEILRWYLNYGVLPLGSISSLKVLGKSLSADKGKSMTSYRFLLHGALQSAAGRKNVMKLLSFLDEDWYLRLLHPRLSVDLDFLNRSIKNRLNKNFYSKLRIVQKLDRLVYITDIWKSLNVSVKHSVQILVPMVEDWVKDVDPVLVSNFFGQNEAKPTLHTLLLNASQKIKRIVGEQQEQKAEVKKESIQEIEEVDYAEGVTIANAGLILCWPFYGRFFSALGMVQNGRLEGELMEEKAVQLFQYIATGKSETEEWNLTLNKILAGVNPDFPVSPHLELSEEEVELCNKLINGTIYNWEKIRGTKLETFRETFLNREGRLYEKDNRWELVVEKKAYDVLLDTLPWNISMINLSWMKKRLTIQWQ